MSKLDYQRDDHRRQLYEVARLWGVTPAYQASGKLKWVAANDLAVVLEHLLGEELSDERHLQELRAKCLAQHAADVVEPVIVAWEGQLPVIRLSVARVSGQASVDVSLTSESGELTRKVFRLGAQTRRRRQHFPDPYGFEAHLLPLRMQLPYGYHQLSLKLAGEEYRSLIIAAPRSLHAPAGDSGDSSAPTSQKDKSQKATERVASSRRWGLFTPVYALRSEEDWGVGSLRELAAMQRFVTSQGGSFVGTLPMLAIDDYASPSPYAPTSRLFWNEIYLDVDGLVAESGDPGLKALLTTQQFLVQKHTLQDKHLVNYQEVYRLKESVLTRLASQFFARGHDDSPAFKAFAAKVPELKSYARFKGGTDQARRRYHEYVQFQTFRALEGLAEASGQDSAGGLYVDFPVGVARDGFDSQYFRKHFLDGFSVGAPPDAFFPKGQNWGFLPLHPRAMRQYQHEYWIKSIQHHVHFASVLRIDHVMGLHRLYVIPDGQETACGAYLRYPADEVYAILCLEGMRKGCMVVGEDLGTVPAGVPRAMGEHGIDRMWVYQYEAEAGPPAERLAGIPVQSMAGVNTHDMPTFAGFWQAADLRLNEQLGLADADYIAKLAEGRKEVIATWMSYFQTSHPQLEVDDLEAIFAELLKQLANSQAEMLVVNTEDLWGEPSPQNVPGTTDSYPNWQKRHRYRQSEWQELPDVQTFLEILKRARPATQA